MSAGHRDVQPVRRTSATRATPLHQGIALWGILAAGFAYLLVPDRAGAAFGAWDAALQVVTLALLFVVVPATAVFGADAYRAHVADSPEDLPRHRAGLALTWGAGIFATGAYVLLALTYG